MDTCKTCAWWFSSEPDKDGFRANYAVDEVVHGLNPVTFEMYSADDSARLFGHQVNQCHSPNLRFYERPIRNGCAVLDGSQYFATLVTGEDFSCAQHTPKED